MRFGNGTWQGWGDIQFPNLPTRFAQGDIDCAEVANELHAVVTDFITENIWHTIRNTSNSWNSWQPLIVPGNQITASQITCAGDGTGLHVFAKGSGGQLFHTIRSAAGTWQAWTDVGTRVSLTFAIYGIDSAGVGGDVHIVARQEGGFDEFNNIAYFPKIWHTILFANGSWQPFWGDVLAAVPGTPANLNITSVGCAGIGTDLHVVIADSYSGKIWHTIRDNTGAWTPWGDVMLAATPAIASISTDIVDQQLSLVLRNFNYPMVRCANVGNGLQLVVVDYFNQVVWHTIRFANGAWTPWGRATSVIPPPPHTPRSPGFGCAGVGSDLHVVG